jgi:hypothetical protein
VTTKARGAGLPTKSSRRRSEERSTPAVDVPSIAREVLRYLLSLTAPSYSTRAGEAPLGYSRDRWRQIAHAIGRRRGRYWLVSAAELAAYEGRACADVSGSPARSSWSPAVAANDLGLRVLDGGKP